ncbi:hypothetical protein H8D79_01590 [PVC group bacterium]|nr:hypothetical protein [PVC group bacterium]
MDVVLDDECKAAFDRDEARQQTRGLYLDGSPARRVYENFMSYYWSGRRSYFELDCQSPLRLAGYAWHEPDRARDLRTQRGRDRALDARDQVANALRQALSWPQPNCPAGRPGLSSS